MEALKRLTCWRILHPTQQSQKAGALYSLPFKENDQYRFLVFWLLLQLAEFEDVTAFLAWKIQEIDGDLEDGSRYRTGLRDALKEQRIGKQEY